MLDNDNVLYVAVLKRAIPVNDYSTDTLVHLIAATETVEQVMKWAEKMCKGAS
jgi:hypothetical protein